MLPARINACACGVRNVQFLASAVCVGETTKVCGLKIQVEMALLFAAMLNLN